MCIYNIYIYVYNKNNINNNNNNNSRVNNIYDISCIRVIIYDNIYTVYIYIYIIEYI